MKLTGLSEEETSNLIPEGTILLAYRGSIAHGMYVPSDKPNSIDDKDLMGVCVPNEKVYFGLHSFEQKEVFYGCWDSVVYEARKFVRLLIGQNPNVLSLLWNDPKYYILREPAGQLLIDNRMLFVSRKAYHSFTGYAYGQFRKMTNLAFKGYMGDKRKRLVEKFGYDTKNAAHLIRLLKMGIEFMRTGELLVDRSVAGDSQQLLSIKNGEWTLDQVKAESDRLFKRAESVYDECKLPRGLDMEKIEALLMQIIKSEIEKAVVRTL